MDKTETARTQSFWRSAGWLLFLACIARLMLDMTWVVWLPERIWDWEAGQNVGVGHLAWTAKDLSLVFPLRHKAFCGGCSLWSILGLGYEDWFLSKLPSLIWAQLVGVAGIAVLIKYNHAAAVFWAWFYALLPPLVREVQLVGWANHAESVLFILLSLLNRSKPFAQGLLLGIGISFSPSTIAAIPSLFIDKSSLKSVIQRTLGVAMGCLLLLIPSTTDSGHYTLQSLWNIEPKISMFLNPITLGTHLDIDYGGFCWICLWIVGCVTLWRKESHHLVKFSLLFLLGWLLLPIDVPSPMGILGARYIVPWFLISGLVIALFLGEMTQRFGKLLPLSPLLGLLYYTINVNFQSREVQSVEWGMLLPIVAHRLPPETLPSPSNDPYWSVVAGIQHGWAWRSEKMMEESVLKTAEGWRNTFWSGFGLTGNEVSLAAFDTNERDEYCLGLHINALNSQKPPVQCWPELGETLRQKRPQSPPLGFEDGVLHRRNHWPVGETDDFSRGYNHPLSSTRRTLFPPSKKDGNE